MKTFTLPFALLLVLAAWSLPATAGDAQEKKETQFKIVTADAGKAEFELEDLAPGQSKTFTTDTGKTIEVTRSADGYKLDIDGEEVVVKLDEGAHGGVHVIRHGEDAEGEGHRMVVIKKRHLGEGGAEPMIVVAEGDDGEGGTKVVRKRVVARVGEDGEQVEVKVLDDEDGDGVIALDGLDLETLAGEGMGDGHKRVIVIHLKNDGADGEGKRVEVRVKKKVEQDDNR